MVLRRGFFAMAPRSEVAIVVLLSVSRALPAAIIRHSLWGVGARYFGSYPLSVYLPSREREYNRGHSMYHLIFLDAYFAVGSSIHTTHTS
jgi:hypothetical protein